MDPESSENSYKKEQSPKSSPKDVSDDEENENTTQDSSDGKIVAKREVIDSLIKIRDFLDQLYKEKQILNLTVNKLFEKDKSQFHENTQRVSQFV